MMVLLRNRHNLIFIGHLFRYRFDWPMVRSILHIGVPNGLENSMFQLGKILLLSLVSGFGTAANAANAAAGDGRGDGEHTGHGNDTGAGNRSGRNRGIA